MPRLRGALPGRGRAIKICPKDKTEYGDDISFCPICGTHLAAVGLRKGEVVGGSYRVMELLGRGWAGAVYKAEHSMMGRATALKIITSPVVADPAFIERFRQAAASLSELDSPYVAMVHDLGLEQPNRIYIASEYIEGKSLAKMLAEEGPLAAQRFLDIINLVLEGLKSAHEMGVVHGSIKPSNVIIANDNSGPRLVDFGIQRIVGALGDEIFATQTSLGRVYGEIAYLAPEQIAGDPGDVRTDIYAMGLMMYELLTGAKPFRQDTAEALARAQAGEHPAAPREFKPQLKIPKFVEKAIMQALEKKPRKRQQTAGELLEELQAEIIPEEAEGKGVWQRARAAVMPPKPEPAEAPTDFVKAGGAGGGIRAAAPAAPAAPARPQVPEPGPEAPGGVTGPRFILYEAKKAKSVWVLTKPETRIGRAPDCDIILEDRTVSRVHAVVVSKPDRIFVEDLNSMNGTYINNEAVKRGHIEDGDEVAFGNVVLVFRTT